MNSITLIAVIVILAALILLRRKFFSGGSTMEELKSVKARGAALVDVRSVGEYDQAHAPGSRNIPLDQLSSRLKELDRAKPIIVCCASGGRSGMAKQILEKEGFSEVYNAGPWQKLLEL